MKVLITGSGAREHALAWASARSDQVSEVLVAPGNGGTCEVARNVPIAPDDKNALLDIARREEIGLAVLGPDASVAAGVGDALRSIGIPCFGPDQAPGQLEASKVFAKRLMDREGIPTAEYAVFTESEPARQWARHRDGWVVVKADGLAKGKGVLVCASIEEADQAIEQILVNRAFGAAGDQIVVEERLEGEELSFLALVDGETVVPLAPARDYKRAEVGNRGLNTGGMGAYSPPVGVNEELVEQVMQEVLLPTVRGLTKAGLHYQGVLYAGLMLTSSGLQVIEFNCRFGDPEAQVIIPRLESDLVVLMLAAATGRLSQEPLPQWRSESCVGVVIASGGYPGEYRTGWPIEGLSLAARSSLLFHAGTARKGDQLLTSGGRVMTVVGRGDGVALARQRALAAAQQIQFEGAFFRSDIAQEAEMEIVNG
ncbi:MAG: phosphoribosylamine--glycine ligase [Candidatus Dormibacteraceae bacterium]